MARGDRNPYAVPSFNGLLVIVVAHVLCKHEAGVRFSHGPPNLCKFRSGYKYSIMHNVYLALIPFQLTLEKTPIYFPYSIGMLWSYALTSNVIRENCDLKEMLFLKEPIDDIINRMDNPTILGLSCYMWNMNYTMEIAKRVKEKWPDCKVIAGGPSVPVTDNDFFDKHPYVDIVVYREGEIVFKDLLIALIENAPLDTVRGIGYHGIGNKLLRTADPIRVEDLDQIPSPYLTGLFDGILERCRREDRVINGLVETNRGCPFSCTFCDWGNGTLGKVKKFDMRRVKKEFLWFAKNKIEFITNCDANFGAFKDRDLEITKWMIKLKKRYKFPEMFDTNWHKNQSPVTVEMAKLLLDNGLLRRFTSSIQTETKAALDAIKRKNLSEKNVTEIVMFAKKQGILTLTEMIIGLPEDTFDSFQDGYIDLVERGVLPTASPLTVLPNSEMATPEYRKKYGLQTVINQKQFAYGLEDEEMVVSTRTMTVKEFERIVLWCWFFQQFHTCGYTNVVYDFFKKRYGENLKSFYNQLLELSLSDRDLMMPNLVRPLDNHVEKKLTYKLSFGMINNDMQNKIGDYERDAFYQDLGLLLKDVMTEDIDLIDDLIKLQDYNQISVHREQFEVFELGSNLYDYIYNDAPLIREPTVYSATHNGIEKRFTSYGHFIVQARFTLQWKCIIAKYDPSPEL